MQPSKEAPGTQESPRLLVPHAGASRGPERDREQMSRGASKSALHALEDPSRPLLQGPSAQNLQPERCCCCTPFSLPFRALVLLLACSLTFGSYYSYDNPGALTPNFKSDVCHNSTFQYELLYSIYSWPNTIQPFIGGYLIDKVFGLRFGALLFCVLIAFGTCVVALAVSLPLSAASNGPLYEAIAGRFIFGLGGESLTVTQNTFIARWFRGRELATAFAITLSFSRIGSALNFAIARPIANQFSFAATLWGSAFFCVISCLCGIALWIVDLKGERAGVVGSKEGTSAADEDADCKAVAKVFRCREVLLYSICCSFYISVFVFITIASDFFVEKYNVTHAGADLFAAIPYTVSAIVSPFLGFAVDRIGFSAQFVLVASVNLCAIHALFAAASPDPTITMVWLGLTYSLCAASLWPMVALIVDISSLGTAYGLMTALQNLGLAVAPLVIGPLIDQTQGGGALKAHLLTEWIFAGCAALAVVLTLALICVDGFTGDGILYSSASRVSKIQAARKKMDEQQGQVLRSPSELILTPKTVDNLRAEYLRRLDILIRHKGPLS